MSASDDTQNKMEPEVIIVENDVDEVSCDGGIPALGHPRVWYSFDKQDKVTCGYCGRIFVKRRSIADDGKSHAA